MLLKVFQDNILTETLCPFHILTGEQVTDILYTPGSIEALAKTAIDEIRVIPVQIDQAQPLEEQIRAIVDAVQLTPEEWQTRHLLINPPGYAPACPHRGPPAR